MGDTLILRTRTAWAHDRLSNPTSNIAFVGLPGSHFTVTGAIAPADLFLASAGAEVRFRNGFSLGAQFDDEFGSSASKHGGMARLRYSF